MQYAGWVDLEAPSTRDTARADDAALLRALQRGDERAFLGFVQRHHGALVRVALGYVRQKAVAEEVAQEAWAAFLESLTRFRPETATVRTWLFRILINCARAQSRKERHTTPLSALGAQEEGPDLPLDRFVPDGELWAGHWSSAPRTFVLDDPAVSRETRELLLEAIDRLPASQREVMVLADVEGLRAAEVCAALALSESNQRVLLHRARTRVRHYLEERLGR